jgi:hypothetical protein
MLEEGAVLTVTKRSNHPQWGLDRLAMALYGPVEGGGKADALRMSKFEPSWALPLARGPTHLLFRLSGFARCSVLALVLVQGSLFLGALQRT